MIFWVNNTVSLNPQLIAFFWFTIRHILRCALSTRCALAITVPESRFMWENCGWRSPRKQGRGGCLIAAWELGPGDLRHCAQPCRKTRENELELHHCHHQTRGLRSEVIAPDVCGDGGKKEMKSGDRWRPVGGLNGSAQRTEVVCSASWRQIQSRGRRCSQYALVPVCVRACERVHSYLLQYGVDPVHLAVDEEALLLPAVHLLDDAPVLHGVHDAPHWAGRHLPVIGNSRLHDGLQDGEACEEQKGKELHQTRNGFLFF